MKIKLLDNFYSVIFRKKMFLFLGIFLSLVAYGQLTLGTSPYTQTFDGIGSGLPTGWTVRSTASATSLGTAATVTTAATAWADTAGAFKNFASADGLTSAASTTAQSGSTDRVLGVRQSGSFADPGAAFVLQLSNTTGKASFNLSFKLQSLDNTVGRTVTWRVDYGVGASPTTFTAVTTSPASIVTSPTWGSTNVTVTLPAAIDNNSGNVWIRIVALTASSSTGSRPTSAIDDVSLSWSSSCSAPTVSSTTSAANNSTTGVDLTGSVTAIGGANVSEVGFNYSTSSSLASPSTSNNTGLSVSTVPYAISKSLTGLQPNTLYYYRAYAINSCTSPQTSYSHTSSYPSFTTLSLAPASAAADNILTDSFRANWTAPTGQGAVSYTYHLEIDDNNDFSSPIYNDESLTVTNHTQSTLAANTTYYYRVRVKNAGGYSAWSSVQTVTTAASSKPVVTASSFNGTVGISFSQNIIATNIPDSYAIVAGNNLPAGLTLNLTTGAITGTPTTAGTFTTNVTATKNGETSDPATLTFNIAKGSQTISGLASTQAKTYGDAAYTLSAVSSSGLTVTYTSSDTSVATVSGNTVTIVGAGTSTITAHQAGDSNWNAAADVSQSLTVAKKGLTITGLSAANKTYDQTAAVVVSGTPQYSGLVNGDVFAVTGTVSWAFANKAAGINKTLVRTGDYDVPSNNYSLTQPSLQATIDKKDISITSITADDKVYNGTATAAFSNVASSEVISGDVVTFTITGNFSDANAGLDKPVTVLSATLGGTDSGNYNIPVFPTGLTADITKANQTITVSNFPATVNLGATLTLSMYATASSGLALNYATSAPAIANISSGTLTANNAGTVTITFSQPGNGNYNAAPDVQQSLDVVEVPVPLAQWDFNGLSSSTTATTVTAQFKDSSLGAGSAVLTRGPGAAYSSGNDSFRTVGFQNNGISTSNTDYFQTSFNTTDEILSLTSIRANVIGTSTFVASPGVQVQFAYSFNNVNYTLINSPVVKVGNGQIDDINLAGVTALQNIPAGTTVYFRFYATGQTSTGGFGFSSPSAGTYGLEFYARLKPSAITWDGSSWSNFNGPDKYQSAVIDGAYSLPEGFEANNMTITNDGLLTILPNQGVIINGDITMPDDKIIIESDGSLVQTKLTNGNSPNKAIAKRTTSMRTSDYTFWSSPVKDQPLLNTVNPNAANSSGGFSEGTPNNRTYQYNETDDTFRATADATFIDGKGYAIRGKSSYGNVLTPDELTYRGDLNNGDISIQIQKSKNTNINGVPYEHGYNLIGNPYPSHIDFEKFYNLNKGDGENNSDVIFGKAWFWSNISISPSQQGGSAYTANNYATLTLAGGTPATGTEEDGDSATPNNFIKLGQGFIVQMRGTAPTGNTPDFKTLKFDNSIRSTNSTGVFYNSKQKQDVNRYWLKLTSPKNVVNTILLAHMTEATDGYDPDYDAELLSVGDDSFYSKLQTKKLQIQARKNPFNSDDVISLTTKQAVDGVYKISLGNKEGVFNNGQSVYLKDKLLNKTVNLSQGAYTFQAVKGTYEGRFEIVYKEDAVLAANSVIKSDFEVYRDGSDYVVRSSKKLGQLDVYDTSGRLVKSYHSKDNSIRINVSSMPEGIYIIKAENSGDIKTKKIIK